MATQKDTSPFSLQKRWEALRWDHQGCNPNKRLVSGIASRVCVTPEIRSSWQKAVEIRVTHPAQQILLLLMLWLCQTGRVQIGFLEVPDEGTVVVALGSGPLAKPLMWLDVCGAVCQYRGLSVFSVSYITLRQWHTTWLSEVPACVNNTHRWACIYFLYSGIEIRAHSQYASR